MIETYKIDWKCIHNQGIMKSFDKWVDPKRSFVWDEAIPDVGLGHVGRKVCKRPQFRGIRLVNGFVFSDILNVGFDSEHLQG